VYNLVTKCFYDKKKYGAYSLLKDYRKQLLANHQNIEITDFGAGSRVFKSNTRKISAIAKTAGITTKNQQLLFRLSQYFKAKNTLELGTSLGLGTVALATGNSDNKIMTIEGCPNTSAVAQGMFNQFKLNNIQLDTSDFEAYFRSTKTTTYNLVYIDGNHSKKHTLAYFNILLENATNESIFIFDDIYWSPEMTEAWQEIIAHPKVTVSIDTFQWGFIFLRKEQLKQHFNIRL
jgi:predicted O-methyltransferase YrrM